MRGARHCPGTALSCHSAWAVVLGPGDLSWAGWVQRGVWDSTEQHPRPTGVSSNRDG